MVPYIIATLVMLFPFAFVFGVYYFMRRLSQKYKLPIRVLFNLLWESLPKSRKIFYLAIPILTALLSVMILFPFGTIVTEFTALKIGFYFSVIINFVLLITAAAWSQIGKHVTWETITDDDYYTSPKYSYLSGNIWNSDD